MFFWNWIKAFVMGLQWATVDISEQWLECIYHVEIFIEYLLYVRHSRPALAENYNVKPHKQFEIF